MATGGAAFAASVVPHSAQNFGDPSYGGTAAGAGTRQRQAAFGAEFLIRPGFGSAVRARHESPN